MPCLKSQEQNTGCWEQKNSTVHAPALDPTKRVGKPPKPALQPDPWTHSYPHRTWETIWAHLREQARAAAVCSCLLCCSSGPSKALPEFLVWLVINSCLLRKTKNPSQQSVFLQNFSLGFAMDSALSGHFISQWLSQKPPGARWGREGVPPPWWTPLPPVKPHQSLHFFDGESSAGLPQTLPAREIGNKTHCGKLCQWEGQGSSLQKGTR